MKLETIAQIKGENWFGFTLHYHPDVWQIDYYFEGEGRYLIDNHWVKIEKNCLFIIPPYKNHQAEKMFNKNILMGNYSMKIIFEEKEVKKFFLPKNAVKIYLKKFKEIEKVEFYLKNILGYYILDKKSKIERFLLLFLKTLSKFLSENNDSHIDKIKYINEILETNYDRKITLEFLGRIVNLNPQYLCRRYKVLTGENIFDKLNRIRMEKALEYLANTDEPIKKISHLCGFKNVFYFSAKFKDYFETTPKKMRKNSKSL